MGEFKIDDWVYVINTEYGRWLKKGDIFKIPNLKNNTDTSDFVFFEKHCSVASSRLRKALPHEIPSNELIIEIW
jgi:hypothetical protein